MPAIFFGGAGGECISLQRISILKENSFRRKKEIFEALDLLVALHVLLAAETFSTDVAMVEGGGVASLGIQHLIILPTTKNYFTS